MQLSDIQIRDPFVLVEPGRGSYLLFGSTDPDIWAPPGIGFDCYRSTDLVEWDGPHPAFRPPADFWSPGRYWAPEVYIHAGAWWMFATFSGPGRRKGTQILRADDATGPFLPWSDGPVTPPDWECLDGSLHVDDEGDPWMVFCHEWMQVVDGEICAVRLSSDLRAAVGEPIRLFAASEAPWPTPFAQHPDPTGTAGQRPCYVTDGPFLHRAESGDLVMLWSSFVDGDYAMGIARSTSGSVLGPWIHDPDPLWSADGGHGMLFRDLEGRLLLTLHSPNATPHERARFVELHEHEGRFVVRTADTQVHE